MILGTQWYMAFNVIDGASAFPADFKEAAAAFRIHGWRWWRDVILPGIFPYYVTGAITASGQGVERRACGEAELHFECGFGIGGHRIYGNKFSGSSTARKHHLDDRFHETTQLHLGLFHPRNAAVTCIPYDLNFGSARLYFVVGLVFPRQFIERRLVTSFPVATFRYVKLLVFVIFNAGTVLVAPAISFSIDASRFH